MTYEMFFEAVKSHLKKAYFGDLPEYKLVEYMKSQEDVIQDQYDYWNWQVGEIKKIQQKKVVRPIRSIFFMRARFVLIEEVYIYVLFWQEKMVL